MIMENTSAWSIINSRHIKGDNFLDSWDFCNFSICYDPLFWASLSFIVISICAHFYLHVQNKFQLKRQPLCGMVVSRVTKKLVTASRGRILTIGELVIIVASSVFLLWMFINPCLERFASLNDRYRAAAMAGLNLNKTLFDAKWDFASAQIGHMAFALFACVLLPVARNSIVLRVFRIPFEKAIKYHRWASQAMVGLSVAHGTAYWISWIRQGTFWEKVTDAETRKINILFGEIALLIGVFLWISSVPFIRRRFFEAFLYSHHFHFLFFLTVALHFRDLQIALVFPAFILFAFDKTLRIGQSFGTVKAESVSELPDGCLKISIPVQKCTRYNPFDVIFLNIPSVSTMEWHPLSVSSISTTGKSVSVILKPLGDWSKKFGETVGKLGEDGLSLKVVGPYGQYVDYFSMYNSLVLVAGGIGITPFLSLLAEIYGTSKGSESPRKSLTLIWATKSKSSLQVLREIEGFEGPSEPGIRLDVQIYITGRVDVEHSGVEKVQLASYSWAPERPMMTPIGGDNEIVLAFLFLVFTGTVLGVVVFVYGVLQNYDLAVEAKTVFLVLTFLAGNGAAGLLVLAIWNIVLPHYHHASAEKENQENAILNPSRSAGKINLLRNAKVVLGEKPNFKRIFLEVSQKVPCEGHVGVFASGPPGMVENVASACMKHCPILGKRSGPTFSFHSVSFEL